MTNNIVRMAFALIVCLAATSGLLFLAGAYFVGAMQLMIYVGGTVVLLIFGVMLTAQKAFITMRTPAGDWILGLLVGGALLAILVQLVFLIPQWQSSDYQSVVDAQLLAFAEELNSQQARGEEITAAQRRKLELMAAKASEGMPQRTGEIGLALVGVRADKIESEETGLAGYLLPFEIVSVHLLVVLVGAAFLARAKRHHHGGDHQ
ncbi:hypothetical protein C5Y96_14610 [Blastopirellula marina]|uniref:NADH-quinone oxidoreductase subunit J n=2 Tax=Pirellulales TaxID=2691354 RepID=A0A2S8FF33_9BACT|nr:hypothetical protein C5Y96_14610 [Blastopirellula marina]RCS50915.1 NADH-quinone oxidoreductase subunit J [Bremerella cremea]